MFSKSRLANTVLGLGLIACGGCAGPRAATDAVAARWISLDPSSLDAHRAAARAALSMQKIPQAAEEYRIEVSPCDRCIFVLERRKPRLVPLARYLARDRVEHLRRGDGIRGRPGARATAARDECESEGRVGQA